jgi:hypothetical protein
LRPSAGFFIASSLKPKPVESLEPARTVRGFAARPLSEDIEDWSRLMAAKRAKKAEQTRLTFGAIGGDGASLHLYASSNQDMISLSVEPNGSGRFEPFELFNSLGIYWINDLKAHLSGTEKENHRG